MEHWARRKIGVSFAFWKFGGENRTMEICGRWTNVEKCGLRRTFDNDGGTWNEARFNETFVKTGRRRSDDILGGANIHKKGELGAVKKWKGL
jgi:hypothetical protein